MNTIVKSKGKKWLQWWLPTMKIGSPWKTRKTWMMVIVNHKEFGRQGEFNLMQCLWWWLPITRNLGTFKMGQLQHAHMAPIFKNQCIKRTLSFTQSKHFGSFEGIYIQFLFFQDEMNFWKISKYKIH